MSENDHSEVLGRIEKVLAQADEIFRRLPPGSVKVAAKAGGSLVTEADRMVDSALRKLLPRDGEGWLSEESADDLGRLQMKRVWVVDPLDGTGEFVAGIPEWCVSVGFIEEGRAVAGGISNPSTGEVFLGSVETGITYNGKPRRVSGKQTLEGALVLASRSEVNRGEWERYRGSGFAVRAVGSVAYKLALVAAGLADATWTAVPKHEWDIAAGVALVLAAGGVVYTPEGEAPTFNRRNPWLSGLAAHPPALRSAISRELRRAQDEAQAGLGQTGSRTRRCADPPLASWRNYEKEDNRF